MSNTSHGDRVRRTILDHGVLCWRQRAAAVTARDVAKSCGMSHANVLYHFNYSVRILRDAIAAHAVAIDDVPAIMHLIASRHPAVDGLTTEQCVDYMRRASEQNAAATVASP